MACSMRCTRRFTHLCKLLWQNLLLSVSHFLTHVLVCPHTESFRVVHKTHTPTRLIEASAATWSSALQNKENLETIRCPAPFQMSNREGASSSTYSSPLRLASRPSQKTAHLDAQADETREGSVRLKAASVEHSQKLFGSPVSGSPVAQESTEPPNATRCVLRKRRRRRSRARASPKR